LLGDAVFVPLGPALVAAAFQDAGLGESGQAVAEDVVGNAEAGTEVLEPANTPQGVTDHEQGPPVTHDLQRARDRADLTVIGAREHITMLLASGK
jgi:hypothetical protein